MNRLINEAKERVAEIAKATKNCHPQKVTALYENEYGGITLGYIQKGWSTRTRTIHFWGKMTKKQVAAHIDEIEIMEKEMSMRKGWI